MTSNQPLHRVAIIGLGLMGGSLGLAVKRKKLARVVVGYARRARTRNQALAGGVVDEVFSRPESAVRNADLVIFCVPVGAIPALAKMCASALSGRAVVTDVGSIKAEIVARVEPLVENAGACFVGSHPIAGSERQGLKAASPRLYENAVVILTPTPRTAQRALRKIKLFWSGLGARVVLVSPEAHDRMLARTSHLPHLVAALLASTVGRDQPQRLSRFCGPGFMDATRIAEGSPDLWWDIVAGNRKAVTRELQAFQGGLTRLIQWLKRHDLDALRSFLEESRTRRRKLVHTKT
ncbi:MAG: prephenate dehydrogenase/arogenate dehydrogenase family protein [Verrucomicrobia bacterium]|nr:prephenate dehydrogenase/arogenate dehydrogenase family protein [Verrucomicrobiota bacterium]MCG2680199.1 prephenate dehydrogenase/arogenate dehydrogenase family protein [Kiritimatiellia bacterium]MBU4247517.1 prephenate dehydrogenase/arogenate dehydrogenase family protein [Verrucomicrobiota bacterium]MBU4289486.1 prephenate dehydrogenase/arogenate dehydrogenase family protein [Verrucomicrobiota bacterium]MBU4427723.1 prephenate dehydrogenase/arogenate dehydrogenase family protein [Verrucomi